MDDAETLWFENAQEWREWLAEHHASEREAWLGLWKKHTGRAGVSYPEAVDQALCFGWIDSVLRRIDDDRHRQRFTPRRPGSVWSNVNVAKVRRLEEEGLMTPAGRAAFDARRPDREGVYAHENEAVPLAEEYAAALRASPAALAFFQSQPPSYRRLATSWVMSAKRADTRTRRMATLVADCEAGRLIKPARYGERR